ncbi:hypothetical protein FACS1894104_2430 [Actinomycetota bacterium]|nr:hypothetical protein FACS1894104_2430 [Actinomycetota bacterium]
MTDTLAAFTKIINQICAEDNIRIEHFSEGWAMHLAKADKSAVIYWRDFGLNNSSAYRLICDKSALSQFLTLNGVANIPHSFFGAPIKPWNNGADNYPKILELLHEHRQLVCKDNLGTSGYLVYRCQTEPELRAAVDAIFSQGCDLAVSPFVEIQNEYRLVMLDGRTELVFAKQRQNGQWKSNLGLGAMAVIETDPGIIKSLGKIAVDVCKLLDLRFVSVDIVNVDSNYQVLEINGGVSMCHFAGQNPDNYRMAKQIYRKAIYKALGLE